MSIEDTLHERIGDLSADVHGGPSLQRTLEKGRARRRRRAAAKTTSGVASVCAVGVVAVAAFTGAGPFADDGTTNEAAGNRTLAVPPGEVIGEINDAFYANLRGRVDVTPVIGRAYDENFERLPEPKWNQAVNWSTTFHLPPKGERVKVSVFRAGSEAQATVREQCRVGDTLHCDLSPHSSGADVVESERRYGGGDRRSFERRVDVIPGGDYLIHVKDVVRASTYEEAESEWTLDLEAMSGVATDGDLLDLLPGS